jgi:DNA-binding NarL/FixJ family response regulator
VTAPTITVWLIEDNAVFRRTVARTIAKQPGFVCDGEFGRAEDALAALQTLPQPRIILLDVGLPGMSGIEAIPQLRERAADAAMLVLTVFEDEEKIVAAICAGAAGYLLKTASPEELRRAMCDALAGGAPMNSRIARRVLDMFSKLAPRKNDYHLTDREREVLQLMVEGFIKKEIADKLSLSVHTVDTYLRNIYGKLRVNTRGGAVAKALKERLL